MENKPADIKVPGREAKTDEQIALEGVPVYPSSEDIYRQSKEEQDIDPENINTTKIPNDADIDGEANERGFEDDHSGNDLDIPGAELDDDEEEVGSEDEENNYYSIGGDNHNALDEGQGE
jgi:hypothetical protein